MNVLKNIFIKEVEELRQVRNELKASNEMQKHGKGYLCIFS